MHGSHACANGANPAAVSTALHCPARCLLQYILCEATQKLPQLVAFLQASQATACPCAVPPGRQNARQSLCFIHRCACAIPTPLVQEHASEKVIVYFLTCACVDFMSGG